jgi:hypothetical protein
MNPKILKVIGIVDGVAMAGIAALGKLVPEWEPVCSGAVMVLGTLGTLIGSYHAATVPS